MMMFGGGGAMRRGNEAGFGGIPEEMLAGVAVLTNGEPDPVDPDVRFSPAERPWKRRLSFSTLFGLAKPAIAGIVVLVLLETFGQQVGPKLIQYALDHGLR